MQINLIFIIIIYKGNYITVMGLEGLAPSPSTLGNTKGWMYCLANSCK